MAATAASTYFSKFHSYCKMVAHAKSLAKRSILIDHCGLEQVLDFISEFKNVEKVYSIEKETRRGLSKLSLVEFKSLDDADTIVKHAHHTEGYLPVRLKILGCNGFARGSKLKSLQDLPFPIEQVRLSSEREQSPSFNTYKNLVSNNLMSLVSLKLRFVTLVNFEHILCSGMFEEYELMPFGSSVMDISSESGDLDLVLTRKEDHYESIVNAASTNLSRVSRRTRPELQNLKLVHLDKSLYRETKDNSGFRGTMRYFDHILREYMPLTDGFAVQSLHRAKVPIIKFTSRVTNIECDLSFDLGLDHRENELTTPVHPGILMTEILYSLCRNNNLVTAIVIYLRIFAKLNSITSKQPGIGMTNFQFLSLIIFFLQRTTLVKASHKRRGGALDEETGQFSFESVQDASNQQAIIPPFKEMMNGNFLKLEEPKHRQHFEEDDLNQTLPKLIQRFFDFYSKFDFANCSINLNESRRERKLDNSAIYVINPMDPTRNICHNVNGKGLETLVKQVSIASANLSASRNGCPLALIKGLMIKNQRLAKKRRTLNIEELQDSGPFTPEDIAQDVCR